MQIQIGPTNIIYIARITNCPGALTNVKTRDGIDEFFLKILKSISVTGKPNAVR